MDVKNDIEGNSTKDNSEINIKNFANSLKNENQVREKRRNNTTQLKESTNLQKRISYQIRNKIQEESKNQETYYNDQNIEHNVNKNYEIYKCLPNNQSENLKKSYTITDTNKNLSIESNGKSEKIKCDMISNLSNGVKEEKKEVMTNNKNIGTQKVSQIPNSNLHNNKEFQIIDENMKSLFFNSSKSNENNSKENEDKFLLKIESQSTPDYDEQDLEKNGNVIRNSYIQKLVSMKLYLPKNRPKTHNSLIIFDWDDTLLPTSYLTQVGFFNPNMNINAIDQKKISKIEKSAYKILKLAISKGDAYIITNAEEGWVEYSIQRFYPKLYEILPKINIISARGEWENTYPGDSREWKIQTFLRLQERLNKKLVTNIICLGDSFCEMEAGRVLAKCFREAFVKTIKFKEFPKLDDLNKQLLLVFNQFNSICSAVKNLTIRVEKNKKD